MLFRSVVCVGQNTHTSTNTHAQTHVHTHRSTHTHISLQYLLKKMKNNINKTNPILNHSGAERVVSVLAFQTDRGWSSVSPCRHRQTGAGALSLPAGTGRQGLELCLSLQAQADVSLCNMVGNLLISPLALA